MNFITPVKYQWLGPSFTLTAMVLPILSQPQGSTLAIIAYVIAFLAFLLIITGIISHRKYIQNEKLKNQEDTLPDSP